MICFIKLHLMQFDALDSSARGDNRVSHTFELIMHMLAHQTHIKTQINTQPKSRTSCRFVFETQSVICLSDRNVCAARARGNDRDHMSVSVYAPPYTSQSHTQSADILCEGILYSARSLTYVVGG